MGIGAILGFFIAVLLVVVFIQASAIRELRKLVFPTLATNAKLQEENAALLKKDKEFAAKPYVIGFNNDQIASLAAMINEALHGYGKPN